MAVIKTQGTNVYARKGSTVTLLTCLTGIDLGGDSTTRIENTCLDEATSKAYLSGLSDPGEGSLTFNIDTSNASHLSLITWAQAKDEGIEFFVGASDGVGIIATTGSPPNTRSWWSFVGGVSTPVPSFEADSIVGYTVTLQRSSSLTFSPKA